MKITTEVLRDVALKANLYRTPELNDKLYLHYKGFQRIESLDKYTGRFFYVALYDILSGHFFYDSAYWSNLSCLEHII